MITIRRQLLGLGFVAASSLVAMQAAHALTGPTAITIDGGPLGSVNLSGGVNGYGWYMNQASPSQNSEGIEVGSALVELQKTTGVLQFTIEVGSVGGTPTLGTGAPTQTSITEFRTGPLFLGYVTIAPPNSPITVSAGHLGSLEGYEADTAWTNPSMFTTAIWWDENSSSTGVEAAGTEGPVTATVEFGDGFDSGVWNYGQALVTYNINSNNALNVYGAMNFGRTGPNAFAYFGGTVGTGNALVNSSTIGSYYSWTDGNLNLVPEIQYVYAKTDALAGVYPSADGTFKSTSTLAAALFGTYAFANTPYSIGGWVEYENSQGNYDWFVGPSSEAMGIAVSPAWQYKDLYARVNAGALYLLRNKNNGATYGYGSDGTGKVQFTGTLEAGLLF